MKLKLLVAMLAVASIGLAAEKVATLIDGRCSICIEEKQKSTVEMSAYGTRTSMFCGNGHYDEDGKYIPPPACNTTTVEGKCSRGHRIVVEDKY